jgi:deazaflavin-dependent oxidoreductase (nitroreductase family)
MTEQITSVKVPAFAKFAMQAQVFLLRRGWMGKMGESVLVITTTGRKSGRPFSTPIGFVRDGQHYVALTRGGGERSNWYLNLRANPKATLEIQGHRIPVRVEFIEVEAERQHAIRLYKEQRAEILGMASGAGRNATPQQIEEAFLTRLFVRFIPA